MVTFRAELFTCARTMLVGQVWGIAQEMPGQTFAHISKQLLQEMGLPEIFEYDGWATFVQTGDSNLDSYKEMVKHTCESESRHAWKRQLMASSSQPHLLLQEFPMSVGARLMEADELQLLWAATDFDLLRIGLISVAQPHPTKRSRQICRLCKHESSHGLIHLCAEFRAVSHYREDYLSCLPSDLSSQMWLTLQADWLAVVFNPHQDLKALVASVKFCGGLVSDIKNASQNITPEPRH